MSKFNLEISGKFRSTTSGNADWYYGGGDEAWADIPAAVAGVPAAVRSGRTVGIIEGGEVVEYIWHPGALGDGDLVEKGGGAKFDSELDGNLVSSEPLGTIKAGTPISAFNGRDFTDILEEALFPDVDAFIFAPSGLTVSSFSTAIEEVGTSYTPAININWNKGTIRNGDNLNAGDASGDLLTLQVREPDANIVVVNPVVNTNNNPTLNPINLVFGDNDWIVSGTNAAGTVTNSDNQNYQYSNNKGVSYIVPEIEAETSNTTPGNITLRKTGRYKYFTYSGTTGNEPSGSTGIRALNSAFVSASNTITVNITASAGNDIFVVYSPAGGAGATLYNSGTNELINQTSASAVNVDDAGGTSVSYTKYLFDFGGVGFPSDTTLELKLL